MELNSAVQVPRTLSGKSWVFIDFLVSEILPDNIDVNPLTPLVLDQKPDYPVSEDKIRSVCNCLKFRPQERISNSAQGNRAKGFFRGLAESLLRSTMANLPERITSSSFST